MHRFDDCIVPDCPKKVRAINLSNSFFSDMARRPISRKNKSSSHSTSYLSAQYLYNGQSTPLARDVLILQT
jgi:hypothetical protein